MAADQTFRSFSCARSLRDGEDPLSIRILPRQIGGSAIVSAYLAGDADAFYQGSPHDLASFRDKLREVEGRFGRSAREAAAAALRPTSQRSQERLNRFVEVGGAMITTGQQAGFLTGPLYTIYKALTVARLAQTLEQEFGTLVLPVFWTASEDHDWAEVDHVHIGTRRGVRRVQLPSNDDRALPMSDRRLDDGVEKAVGEVLHAISYHHFTNQHIKQFVDPYRVGETVSTAFAGMLGSLLEPFDFVLADAADPALKQASLPVLRQALLAPPR